MRSLTGLRPEEFEPLLPRFKRAYEELVHRTFVEREGRRRTFGGVAVEQQHTEALLFG